MVNEYNSRLKKYGFHIKFRDTDHQYNSLRWRIESSEKSEYVPDDVKKLSVSFCRELYGSCTQCGKPLNNGYNKNDTSEDLRFRDCGCILDYGSTCAECETTEMIFTCIGHNTYDVLDYYINYRGSSEGEFVGNWMTMYLNPEGEACYCKLKDLPTPYPINSIGYDTLLKDVNGARVYSNMSAIILYHDMIFSTDNIGYNLYGSNQNSIFQRINIKECAIIVSGYYAEGKYKNFLKELHTITYDELVSYIGEKESFNFLLQPHNKDILKDPPMNYF